MAHTAAAAVLGSFVADAPGQALDTHQRTLGVEPHHGAAGADDHQARVIGQQRMAGVMGGMNLPPGFKLPF